ncbi:MAG: SpoIIE family protein phosphatase, partial [Deltaproteobacteria bacterium]|nr:SpoIIE family protein phosphatase [Deltaproteobacteria bacterium]
ITRAVGTAQAVEVDTREEEIKKGDLILICSDGLSSLADDKDMLDIINRCNDNLDDACEELIGLANFNGGDDNITVVLVKFV